MHEPGLWDVLQKTTSDGTKSHVLCSSCTGIAWSLCEQAKGQKEECVQCSFTPQILHTRVNVCREFVQDENNVAASLCYTVHVAIMHFCRIQLLICMQVTNICFTKGSSPACSSVLLYSKSLHTIKTNARSCIIN